MGICQRHGWRCAVFNYVDGDGEDQRLGHLEPAFSDHWVAGWASGLRRRLGVCDLANQVFARVRL